MSAAPERLQRYGRLLVPAMSDAEQSTAIAGWVQTGGVVAFAGAVLWELRLMRPILAEVKSVLASLLERERMRSEQRAELIRQRDSRRGDSRPPQSRRSSRDEEFGFEDVTDAVAIPIQRRAQTPGRGSPAGKYGPIKPPRDDER